MLGLILILQGLAVIAFFFGVFNASKGLKMFSEDKKSPQGYLMSIGGALAGLSATMFISIKPMGIILWASVQSAVASGPVGMIEHTKIRYTDKLSVSSLR